MKIVNRIKIYDSSLVNNFELLVNRRFEIFSEIDMIHRQHQTRMNINSRIQHFRENAGNLYYAAGNFTLP